VRAVIVTFRGAAALRAAGFANKSEQRLRQLGLTRKNVKGRLTYPQNGACDFQHGVLRRHSMGWRAVCAKSLICLALLKCTLPRQTNASARPTSI
jgi:hypothetical protein